MTPLINFIQGIPKAELHVHIEGTFEPELMFAIAKRNTIQLKYKSVEEIKQAYNFRNLQDFLDIYYAGAGVLREEQDFYDLTWAYLVRIHRQNVLHAEIFFDPQTHTDRTVAFRTVVTGINRALQDGQSKLGISTRLIACFLRHLDEEAAITTFRQILDYKDIVTAVGLDSSEVGHPPVKFQRVFKKAREEGFLTVAHAGEEGPAQYVWEALDLLQVARIDHGNHSLDDPRLVQVLVDRKIPLTVCPLSNLKLRVVGDLESHPLREMMAKGLVVTINSDDPAYFRGYINENYLAVAQVLDLTKEEIVRLAKNSFMASFIDEPLKQKLINQVDNYLQDNSE